jgi:hypothetical protein
MTTLIILALCGVGLYFLAYSCLSIWRGAKSRNWPTAPGQVMTSDLQKIVDQDSVMYRAQVIYKYNVQGQEYVCGRVFFGDGLYSNLAVHAGKEVVRYRQVKQVSVHYDPDSPNRAVLQPGINSMIFIFLSFGILFTVLGIAVATGNIPLSKQGRLTMRCN